MSRFLHMFWCPRMFWYGVLNYTGVVYTWGTILSLLLVNVYFTCPVLEGDNCWMYVWLGYFILFEVLMNFVCFHYYARWNRVESLFPEHATPAAKFREDGSVEFLGDPETTKFCFNCSRTVPLRSHHCPLCKYCVLKKDHHCFLVGGCVGYGNQRYFIIFLFWATLGALYGSFFTWRYLNTYYIPFFSWHFVDYIFPVAVKKFVFFQHCTIAELGYVCLFSAGFGGGGGALIFFFMQMKFVAQGKTMHEAMLRGKKLDSSGENDTGAIGTGAIGTGGKGKFGKLNLTLITYRMEQVFGKYWYLNFLLPLPYKNRLDDTFKKLLHDCHMKEM